jgi:5'(3')-deoxyribonucleotidase
MDGVIADFDAYCKLHDLPPSSAKLRRLAYLSLEPIPGALEAMTNLVVTFPKRVFLLTKIPSQNPHAASEKLLWLREFLPSIADHVIITPDKGCVGRQADVLVDDHPEWANALAFPGKLISFGEDGDAKSWAELLPKLISHLTLQ